MSVRDNSPEGNQTKRPQTPGGTPKTGAKASTDLGGLEFPSPQGGDFRRLL